MRLRRRGLAVLAAGLAVGAGAAPAADEVRPGAYCPLPRAGEKPSCLDPAVAEYGEFFAAVEEGRADDPRLARVESTVAGAAGTEDAYLALSSLAYGYYLLSQRAAETPGADPEIVGRLERWNALLGQAYQGSQTPAYRSAVHQAALDLKRRAPPVRLGCRNEQGETVECHSTDEVLRGIHATADEVGLRGGLRRLLRRISGESTP